MADPQQTAPGVNASKFADPNAPVYRTTPQGDIAMVHLDHSPGKPDNPANNDKVALFMPKGFDPSKPAVIVPYFHGWGGGIDAAFGRQQMADIAAKSGQNFCFVIPQMGDHSEIKPAFHDPKYVQGFLDQSTTALSNMYAHNHPGADPQAVAQQFHDMPMVPVSYSGGFRATIQTLTNPRIKGVVMLDSMYAGNQEFTNFTNRADHPFVAVQYGKTTEDNSVAFSHTARPGSATVVPSGHDHTTLVEYALGGVLQSVTPQPGGQVALATPPGAAKTATAKPAAPH